MGEVAHDFALWLVSAGAGERNVAERQAALLEAGAWQQQSTQALGEDRWKALVYTGKDSCHCHCASDIEQHSAMTLPPGLCTHCPRCLLHPLLPAPASLCNTDTCTAPAACPPAGKLAETVKEAEAALDGWMPAARLKQLTARRGQLSILLRQLQAGQLRAMGKAHAGAPARKR